MKYEEYKKKVGEYRASGQTAAKWCEEEKISVQTLRTWQKRVKKHFVEVLKCMKCCKSETETTTDSQVQSFQKAQGRVSYVGILCRRNRVHVRRKFVEALPQDKELAKSSNAAKAVGMIDTLFALERECKTDTDR